MTSTRSFSDSFKKHFRHILEAYFRILAQIAFVVGFVKIFAHTSIRPLLCLAKT